MTLIVTLSNLLNQHFLLKKKNLISGSILLQGYEAFYDATMSLLTSMATQSNTNYVCRMHTWVHLLINVC